MLKHINGGVINSVSQLRNDDRVMVLLRESLMQSSGSLTPATSKAASESLSKNVPKGVVEGSGGHKIDFRALQKEEFLKD